MPQIITEYHTVESLQHFGVPETTLSRVSPETKQSHVTATNADVDRWLRVRYRLPLLEFDIAFTQWCCEITALKLSQAIGFDPSNKDENLINRALAAEQKFRMVAAGETTPYVVESPPNLEPPDYAVDSDPERCWR